MNHREILGHAIRAVRRANSMSIEATAHAAHLAKSSLQRAETGNATLGEQDVARLDAALYARGELTKLYRAMHGATQRPLQSFHPATRQAGHRWPAEWSGVVWILVLPLSAVDGTCFVDLSWGPWRAHYEWCGGPIQLEDWKVHDSDGVSVTLHARLSIKADVIFGLDHSPHEDHQVVDLRGRWTRAD